MNLNLLDIAFHWNFLYSVSLLYINIGEFSGSLFYPSYDPDAIDWSDDYTWEFDFLFLRQLVYKIKEWRRNDN